MYNRASNDGKCRQDYRFPTCLIHHRRTILPKPVQACRHFADLSCARARSLLAHGCVREKIQICLHAVTEAQKGPENIGQTQCRQANPFPSFAVIAYTGGR